MSTGIATALKVSNELTILTRIKQVNCLIPMIGLFLCADVLANECAITKKSSLPESIFLPEARVQWVELEGGYYRIVDALNRQFLPRNFNQFPQLHHDGLAVCGVLKKIEQGYSFQMGGEVAVQAIELVALSGSQE